MRIKNFNIKAVSESQEGGPDFTGYLTTYGNEDRDGDVIVEGAFAESIKKKSTAPLLFNHERNSVIGKLELEDCQEGVKVKAYLNLNDDLAVKVKELIEMGALDSMSVGFGIKRYELADQENPWRNWLIHEAEIYEGSVVTIPANELAAIEKDHELNTAERAELFELRQEKRMAKTIEYLKRAKGLLEK
ncbi:MAG: HK97 family phage prohead protease [Coriobacteriia bacterium]|nr:HK97 family phage prohead protease [Coriobacteriia bacterium]